MTPQVNIAEKLMVVRLNCSFSFGRITDKAITHETNQAKNTKALTVRKELLPGDAGSKLRELQGVLSSFYAYHKKVTMSSVNEGERLLPVAFYLDYTEEYKRYKARVEEKFAEFETDYPHAVLRAQDLLESAFSFNDYPQQDELREHLQFRMRTLPLPSASEKLLQVVGESVQSDVDGYLGEAVKEALTDVNSRIKTSLQRMVTQLSDPKKKVYDSLTENLVELVSYVPMFNVTSDDSLTLLCEEVKTRLLVSKPEELRNNAETRQATASAAYEILRKMG